LNQAVFETVNIGVAEGDWAYLASKKELGHHPTGNQADASTLIQPITWQAGARLNAVCLESPSRRIACPRTALKLSIPCLLLLPPGEQSKRAVK
jgi:hypothetical protein